MKYEVLTDRVRINLNLKQGEDFIVSFLLFFNKNQLIEFKTSQKTEYGHCLGHSPGIS